MALINVGDRVKIKGKTTRVFLVKFIQGQRVTLKEFGMPVTVEVNLWEVIKI